jgi:arginine-tRNA-protein transferase
LSLLRPAENDMHYYYLGFYVHGCQKMRYKVCVFWTLFKQITQGCFRPSELLCPEAYTFHAIRECIIKLNKTKYSRLNDDTGKGWSNLVRFLLVFNRTLL